MHPQKMSLTPKSLASKSKAMKHASIRIKSQLTISSTPRKSPFLPLIHTPSTYETINEGLPLPNDDFHDRNKIYEQNFILSRKKIIKLEVGFTYKFCYFTLYDMKADIHYKLRVLAETGKQIMERFKVYKLQFKNYIYRDQLKRYFMSIPFPPFERKYQFTMIEISKTVQLDCEDDDLFLKNQIKLLDRTQFIFDALEDKQKKGKDKYKDRKETSRNSQRE